MEFHYSKFQLLCISCIFYILISHLLINTFVRFNHYQTSDNQLLKFLLEVFSVEDLSMELDMYYQIIS